MLRLFGFAGFVALFLAVMAVVGSYAPSSTPEEYPTQERTLNVAKATPAEKAAIARHKARATGNAAVASDSDWEAIKRESERVNEAIAYDLSKGCDSRAVFVKTKAANMNYWSLTLAGVGSVNARKFLSREEVTAIYATLNQMNGGSPAYGTTTSVSRLYRYLGICNG